MSLRGRGSDAASSGQPPYGHAPSPNLGEGLGGRIATLSINLSSRTVELPHPRSSKGTEGALNGMLSKEDNEILCRVGPGTLMGNLLRRYWTPALLSVAVPESHSPSARVR